MIQPKFRDFTPCSRISSGNILTWPLDSLGWFWIQKSTGGVFETSKALRLHDQWRVRPRRMPTPDQVAIVTGDVPVILPHLGLPKIQPMFFWGSVFNSRGIGMGYTLNGF